MPSEDETDIILDKFVEKLVIEKGLSDLDPEVRKEMESMLRERLDSTIFSELVVALSADQQEEFEKLLEKPATADESQAFFERSIPDYANFLAGILVKFRRLYLG